MFINRLIKLLLGFATAIGFIVGSRHATASESMEPLSVVFWDAEQLKQLKNNAEANSPQFTAARDRLQAAAEEALQREPYSVMDKSVLPPSGDKHDYMSHSRYWWPNPKTENGLPYIRRDGEVNRKLLAKGDRNRIGALYDDVETLALAYFFLEDPRYANHAIRLLQTWFINSETRMNPHLNYAQAVPGKAQGRGVGIIDTRHFIRLLDATALLSAAAKWNQSDQAALVEWFREFLNWMRTSDLGREESDAMNNHGSWYDAQTARIAVFVGDRKLARQIVLDAKTNRLEKQIDEFGKQPLELERTRSLHYCFFNLNALVSLARVGDAVGVDLWNHPSPKDSAIRRALDFVLPFAVGTQQWLYPQIRPFSLSLRESQTMAMASHRYGDSRYSSALKHIPKSHPELDRVPLLFLDKIAQSKISPSSDSRNSISVKIEQKAAPSPPKYDVPIIPDITATGLRLMVPQSREGTATVVSEGGNKFLREVFQSGRRKKFEIRQEASELKTIRIRNGAITLGQLVNELDDEAVVSTTNNVTTLRLPLLVEPGATLIIDGKETPKVRLSTERGAFIANAGTLFVLDTTIGSWNEEESKRTKFVASSNFRPFIASYIRSHTYLANSRFESLGYAAPTSYGISLSSQPERHNEQAVADWPTGILLNNEFHDFYYGFYSYEARDVAIIENKYVECIKYGIDPHDRSTRLVIARNSTSGTRERHGIIGSRGINHSLIVENISSGNCGSGIMLDRQCTHNEIRGNQCYQNGQGIAIYESPHNLIVDNRVTHNNKSGIRVRNSTNIHIYQNSISANQDYALEVYAKRLDDHKKREARGDSYRQMVEVSFHGNTTIGNRGLIKANNLKSLRFSGTGTNLEQAIQRSTIVGLPPMVEAQFDHKLAGDLESFSTTFRHALEARDTLIEFVPRRER